MGKMSTYLLVMSGIMLLMYYGGLLPNTNTLLTLLLNPQDISTSSFYINNVLATIELILFGGIILAAVALRDPQFAIFGGVAIIIGDLGWNFISVFNSINTATDGLYTPILVLIFAPIMFLFAVTLLEWWRGITT